MSNPDIEAIGDIIDTYYRAIYFPPGGTPDWDRLTPLFHPAVQFIPLDAKNDGQSSPLNLNGYLRRFHQMNENNHRYEKGFYEREISRKVTSDQHMAHVWSSYEVRYIPDDLMPYNRGVCSMQMVYIEMRWVIVSMCWQTAVASSK